MPPLYNIELEQQSHNAEIRQYADNNLQHEYHNQCITCKLLRQRDITVQHKHADTKPISEVSVIDDYTVKVTTEKPFGPLLTK